MNLEGLITLWIVFWLCHVLIHLLIHLELILEPLKVWAHGDLNLPISRVHRLEV